MDEETLEFLEKLENTYGGKITWKTFSTWYGCSDSTFREYGVFIFKINNTLYFEDFEKKHAIFGMELTTKKKKKNKYVKLQREIKIDEIEKIFKVTQSSALNIIKKYKTADSLHELNLFEKVFKKSVIAVQLKNGTCHFFEFININDFKKNL
ncbi:MAG: hypothetical protein ACPKM0_06130 [Pleomorphochaeta sp.]